MLNPLEIVGLVLILLFAASIAACLVLVVVWAAKDMGSDE